jgi:hypothetical protein
VEDDPIRKQAVEVTLDRNPNAFRPKVFVEDGVWERGVTPLATALGASMVRACVSFCQCLSAGVSMRERAYVNVCVYMYVCVWGGGGVEGR